MDKMPASTDKVQSVSLRRGTCQVEFLVLLSFRLDHGWGKQLPDFSLCGFFNPEGAWRRLGSSAFCENLKSRSPCHTPVLSTAQHSPSRIPPVCSLPYRVLYSSASINPQLWKLNHFIFFFFSWSSFHDIPGKDIVEVTELALPLLLS